jgi:hypothetical protein
MDIKNGDLMVRVRPINWMIGAGGHDFGTAPRCNLDARS